MAAILSHVIRRQLAFTSARNSGPAATAGEHSGGYKVWKRLSFLVALPAVGLCMLNAYLKYQEEHDHPRQQFIKYDSNTITCVVVRSVSPGERATRVCSTILMSILCPMAMNTKFEFVLPH